MKRYIYSLLAMVLLFSFTCSAAYAAEDDPIKLKVQAGYNGEYKYGFTIPVTIEIENNKKDINGELVVEIPTQRETYTAYSVGINMQKGSAKKYTIGLPVLSSTSLDIKIMDGKDELYKTREYVNPGSAQDTTLIGILSDDYDSVSYITDTRRTSNTVSLNEKIFSDKLDLMKMFDCIVINNYDTSRLGKEQYNVLKNWVQGGGLLIIGTGPSSSKTLSIFKDDFVSGDIGELKDVSTNALAAFAGSSSKDNMKIASLVMNIKNSSPLLKDGDNVLLHLIDKGTGHVVISSFDLGLNPITDWDANRLLGARIIGSFPFVNNNVAYEKWGNDYGMINGALRTIPGLPEPNSRLLLIIFGAYVLIVGPISYLILKKKDKRELMWLTVPVLSVIFSAVMYAAGAGTRMSKPIANVISVINVSRNSASGITSYAGIFTPVKSNIKVEAGEGMDIKPLNSFNGDYYPPYNQNQQKIVDTKYNLGSKTTAEFYRNSVWNMRTTGLEMDTIPSGGIECQVNYADSKFTGTIKNTTGFDLEECYLITPNQYMVIGPLKKGESKDISGSALSYNEQYDLLQKLYPDINKGMRRPKLSKEETEALKKQSQNNQLLNYVFMSSGVRDGGVKVVAISSTPVVKDIMVNDTAVKRYEKSLILGDANATFRKGNIVQYPSGYIAPLSVSSTFRGFDPYGSMYYGRGTIELSFRVDTDVKVEEVTIDYRMQGKSSTGSTTVKESLWNFSIGDWQQGSYGSFTIKGGDLKKYINADNVLRIKIESDDDGMNMQLPRISMKGSVK